MTNIVEYSVEGKVALITLNRPEARNAVNGDVANGLEAAIDKLEADDNVWIAILLANTQGQQRPVFCAGADLKAINSGQAAALNTARGGFGGFVYRQRKNRLSPRSMVWQLLVVANWFWHATWWSPRLGLHSAWQKRHAT